MEIFSIYKDKIEGRIDPLPYHPIRMEQITKLHNYSGTLQNLEEVADFCQIIVTENPSKLPYIGLENIESESGDLIEVKDKEKFGTAVLFEKDSILFPKLRPYLNKVFFATFKGIASTEFYVLKSKKCLNKFLYYFLQTNTVVNQTTYLMTGNTLPRLQTEDVKKLLIPLPSESVQKEIIRIMDDAYSEKKQSKIASERLLNNLWNKVLEKLDIKYKTTNEEKIFQVFFEEIKGKRIDPKAHLNTPKNILKAISESKYESKQLSKIVKNAISGEWGIDPHKVENENYLIVKVIRNTNFLNRNNLDLKDVAKRGIEKEKFSKILLKNKDILIEKSGGSPIQPVGRVAIFLERGPYDYTFSNFLLCIRIDEKLCEPEYLFCFLKALYSINYMEYIQNQTVGIKNLIMEEFFSIPIILPPKSIQKNIIEYVNDQFEKIEDLIASSYSIVSEAKRKVEKILFGYEQ